VVNDDDLKRLLLCDEFEAGVLRGMNERGANVVGAERLLLYILCRVVRANGKSPTTHQGTI